MNQGAGDRSFFLRCIFFQRMHFLNLLHQTITIMNPYSKIPFVALSQNLYLRENVIVSYSTEVADILSGFIHTRGRYSRTTTKHISLASGLLNLGVTWTQSKSAFYQYNIGVRLPKPNNLLKPSSSRKMVEFLKQGWTFPEACVLLMDEKRVSWDDRTIVSRYLDSMEYGEEHIQAIRSKKRTLELIL